MPERIANALSANEGWRVQALAHGEGVDGGITCRIECIGFGVSKPARVGDVVLARCVKVAVDALSYGPVLYLSGPARLGQAIAATGRDVAVDVDNT